MNSKHWRTIAGSLFGAMAIHAAFVACSNAPSKTPLGESDARADGPDPDSGGGNTAPCPKWQVQTFLPGSIHFQNVYEVNPDGSDAGPISLPTFGATGIAAGWEPFAATELGAVYGRRCAE
jgi:hypothetical protein